jgi:histidine triad (HIT) family protein
MDCLFCNIVNKKIPADIIYESETVLAFKDISPQAPIHVLIIPKQHIDNVLGFTPNDGKLLSDLMLAIKNIAKKQALENGFRIVTNTGQESGQEVNHLHFHLLGGQKLSWPPG